MEEEKEEVDSSRPERSLGTSVLVCVCGANVRTEGTTSPSPSPSPAPSLCSSPLPRMAPEAYPRRLSHQNKKKKERKKEEGTFHGAQRRKKLLLLSRRLSCLYGCARNSGTWTCTW